MGLPKLRRCSVAVLLALAAVSGAAPARAQGTATTGKTLTVERIYSAPDLNGSMAQGVLWSPDGKQLSYFHAPDTVGDSAKELWVMNAATGKTSVLVNAETLASLLEPAKQKSTQSTGLGRATPEDYEWAPDGRAILFKSDSALVWLDLASMKSKRLLEGDAEIEDARISPDGKWVSYVQDFNLWLINVASVEKKQLTIGGSEDVLKGKLDWLYPEEFSTRTAYWWSPDSSRVAYYEMDERPVAKYPIVDMSGPTGAIEMTRFPSAGEANPIVRVGVIPVSGGETRWLDTGADTNVYLPRVNWLPDSKHVAIQRLNRAQDHLDLLLCDVVSGASHSILTEAEKDWVNLSDDLYFFSDSQRFLWTSERSNFRHIYLYDISGKLLKQLTSGDWTVTGIEGFGPRSANGLIVDEQRGYVYFLTNRADVLEAQLYRVSLNDGSLAQVTHEPGVHEVEMAPNDSAFVDTTSDANTPWHEDVDRIDGTRIAALSGNTLPELEEYHLPRVEFVTVPADDGTTLYASIIKPPNFDPARKYPVVIQVYGGPDWQVVRNEWDNDPLWSRLMSQRGFIVWSLDNRGSTGRGHRFEASVFHHLGRLELADQLAGVKYLKSLPYVDGSRIGVWGWSYGGFMTLMAMSRAPGVFKAGIAVAPVADWRLYDTAYTERYMGLPQDNQAGYRDSAPANFVQSLTGKLLLAHGTGDDNVHFANTALLLNKFIDEGKYPELQIFPGRGHPISDRAARIELFNKITQFFIDNL
ncbi:MAG: S9 family peptidase [Candidatus Acidiferrales bacterium]